MKAFVLHAKQDLRRADLARPTAQAEQVIVQVRRTGICGSDMHYYLHGRVGKFVPNRPFVLGHEFAGEIVELGDGVDRGLLGKRVAVDPSIPCAKCEFCRRGRYNLCLSMRFYGSASCDPHLDGGLSEFVAVPAENCYELPNSVSWGEAALIEPLSVAVHAVFRAGRVAGSSVLVTGGGPIGQFVALVAKAFGAAQVVLSDVANYQRQKALEFGVEAVLDGTSASFEVQAIELSRGGFDIAIEAAGAARALQQALAVARRGATIVQVGTLPSEVTLPLNDVMARELNLVGSFRFANVFGIALDLVSSGRVHIAPCVSAVLPLDSAQTAMQRAIAKLDVIKGPSGTMRFSAFGDTGRQISSISFGASSLGGVFHTVDEAEAIATVHAALEAGINHFDVAPAYGGTRSEIVLGKALKGINRSRYLLSTKVGKYTDPAGYGTDTLDYSRLRIRDSIDESSARLGTDYFDIIHIHDIEYQQRQHTAVALTEGYAAVQELKREGRVGAVSFGIYPMDLWWHIFESLSVDAGLIHNHYCLNDTRLLELLPIAQKRNIFVINASPFASGLLTDRGPADWHPATTEERAVFQKQPNSVPAQGVPISQLALQFSCQHLEIPTTMFSTANRKSLMQVLEWHDQKFDPALVAEVRSMLASVSDRDWY